MFWKVVHPKIWLYAFCREFYFVVYPALFLQNMSFRNLVSANILTFRMSSSRRNMAVSFLLPTEVWKLTSMLKAAAYSDSIEIPSRLLIYQVQHIMQCKKIECQNSILYGMWRCEFNWHISLVSGNIKHVNSIDLKKKISAVPVNKVCINIIKIQNILLKLMFC